MPDDKTEALIDNTDMPRQSRIATRDLRIAQREAGRLRTHFLGSFFPLLLLAALSIGALVTFYRREAVHNLAGDATIAAGFALAVGIIAYLNPQVQQRVQARGRNQHDRRDAAYWHAREASEKRQAAARDRATRDRNGG